MRSRLVQEHSAEVGMSVNAAQTYSTEVREWGPRRTLPFQGSFFFPTVTTSTFSGGIPFSTPAPALIISTISSLTSPWTTISSWFCTFLVTEEPVANLEENCLAAFLRSTPADEGGQRVYGNLGMIAYQTPLDLRWQSHTSVCSAQYGKLSPRDQWWLRYKVRRGPGFDQLGMPAAFHEVSVGVGISDPRITHQFFLQRCIGFGLRFCFLLCGVFFEFCLGLETESA